MQRLQREQRWGGGPDLWARNFHLLTHGTVWVHYHQILSRMDYVEWHTTDRPSKPKKFLHNALRLYGRDDLAEQCGVQPETVTRWNKGEATVKKHHLAAMKWFIHERELASLEATDFTFIDLFAGIGGTRRGFQSVGGRCVWTSEWDRHCKQTYEANFLPAPDHIFVGDDITQVDANTIPDHDVLVGGFPCQPFSIAGVSKKNALGTPPWIFLRNPGNSLLRHTKNHRSEKTKGLRTGERQESSTTQPGRHIQGNQGRP